MIRRPVNDRPCYRRGPRLFHAGRPAAGSLVPRSRPLGASRRLAAWILGAVLGCRALLASADAAPTMLLLAGAATGSEIIAVGERGTILRSTDHAMSWQRVSPPTGAALTALSLAPDGQRGWAVGHDAIILATEDGGRSWRQQWQGPDLEESFLDVLALDQQRVIAVGGYGLYLQSADAGRSWNRSRAAEEDFHLNRISRGPTGTLYIAGERGTLLRSADDGETWEPMRSSYEGSFFGVLPLDAHTLLAYGLRGHVFRSTDDGETWTQIEIPEPVLLATGRRMQNNAILLAGNARTLLVSQDCGRTFSPLATTLMTAVADLLELPGDRVLALGEAGATVLNLP